MAFYTAIFVFLTFVFQVWGK